MEPEVALKKAKKLVTYLRREMPTTVPFKVYFRPEDKMPKQYGKVFGLCVYNESGPSFSIFIRIGTLNEMADSIIHEISHVMSWDASHYDDHGPSWGLAFSQVYTASQDMP